MVQVHRYVVRLELAFEQLFWVPKQVPVLTEFAAGSCRDLYGELHCYVRLWNLWISRHALCQVWLSILLQVLCRRYVISRMADICLLNR
jgi:hypothetical protein